MPPMSPTPPFNRCGKSWLMSKRPPAGIVSTAPDGSFRLIANALKFDGERPGFERPAPELGEATAEMLGTFK